MNKNSYFGLDGDGYPTEAMLDQVKTYPISNTQDCVELLAAIRPYWRYSDCGYWTRPSRTTYEISTGGWSGNESIVAALESNLMFWSLFWYQSRRGGHYIFQPVGATEENDHTES